MPTESGGPSLRNLRAALLDAVRSATLAPSVHNSQPWRFVLHDDGLDLLADRGRAVSNLDPTGRLLVISCGAALLQARIALREAGLTPEVVLYPDGAKSDLLAHISVKDGPPANEDEQELADAIPRRHSQRTTFSDNQVPGSVITRLRAAAMAEGAWLRLLDSEERLVFTNLLDQADYLQRTDPLYRAELASWLRTKASPDGIPAGALPDTVQRSDLLLREFDLDSPAIAAASHRGRPEKEERAEVLLLGTGRDTPQDWLVGGQALGRLLLAATAAGLQGSVLGQVVDLPRPRRLLQARLGLRGPVQVALRVGWGSVAAATPRRPLSDVLVLGAAGGSIPDARS